MPELSLEDHDRLVKALLSSLPRDADGVEPQCIRTHISSVILSGDRAYKIKKPVDFGFLDFTSLERRRFFCKEEVRLNGRLAPQIYLGVAAIRGSVEAPVLDGEGDAVDFAVCMRRFPQEALMSRLAASGRLAPDAMDAVAACVAGFHAAAARAPADREFSTAAAAVFPVLENFEQLGPLVTDSALREQLDRLEQWSRGECARLEELLAERGARGYVRECHGDMHLGNMALIGGDVVIFDGIEFNERMRWTDVLGDVGFLAMDLEERGLTTHAHRFLNLYFEGSGDYAALPLLDFYRVYRAMVRAKVNALRLGQSLTPMERGPVLEAYGRYADLAEGYTRAARPFLCITHGLSGSGKTTVAGAVVDAYGALRLRSDIERKRLHGLAPMERSDSALGAGLYDAEASRKTYERLVELAEVALRAGYPVVVDAAFLMAGQRELFRSLAVRLSVSFVILDIHVPLPTLKRRLARRQARRADASEAGLDVLERQLLTRDALSADELRVRRIVRAGNPDLAAALAGLPGTPGPVVQGV